MGISEFESVLALQCAPTLRGIKAASLISLPLDSETNTCRLIMRYASCLACHGVSVRRIAVLSERALVLFYKSDLLKKILARPAAKKILGRYGYPLSDESPLDDDAMLTFQIEYLTERIALCESFPHEIGLFLGYPPADVEGFIEHGGKDFRCCDFWKVYDNENAARKIFDCYHKCTNDFCNRLKNGATIQEILRRSS
ncbi:MAG: DUF3793 family protein [Schwartzia sp.]|nr:DUF3793 family protein [Schwartzia sp. (in: firmicutes)]